MHSYVKHDRHRHVLPRSCPLLLQRRARGRMAAAAPDSSPDAPRDRSIRLRGPPRRPAGLALTEGRALSLLSPQRGSAGAADKTESLTQGCTGRGGGASQFQEETRRNQEIRSPIPAAGQETSGCHVFASEETKTKQPLWRKFPILSSRSATFTATWRNFQSFPSLLLKNTPRPPPIHQAKAGKDGLRSHWKRRENALM